MCNGHQGGVPGNENRVQVGYTYITMCDYCTYLFQLKDFKPCPVCGEPPTITKRGCWDGGDMYHAECSHGTGVYSREDHPRHLTWIVYGYTEEEAKWAWNLFGGKPSAWRKKS